MKQDFKLEIDTNNLIISKMIIFNRIVIGLIIVLYITFEFYKFYKFESQQEICDNTLKNDL